MLSLVLVVAVSLLLSKEGSKIQSPSLSVIAKTIWPEKKFTPIPVLTGSGSYPILSAQAVLALDVASGVSMYEKDPDKSQLPASTTKIITALTAMDYYEPGSIVTVGNFRTEGQKMGLLVGEKITAEDLLRGLLIYSANDAAEVLAQNYCSNQNLPSGDNCGRDVFIAAMNKRAKELGLSESNFTNPAGLDTQYQMTSARDLANVAMVAMQIPRFATIVGEKERLVKSIDGRFAHRLVSTNKLLGSVEGVLGVKTGWTENARENLVTYVSRNGHKVVVVVLGSQDRFGETKELIDYIFSNYEWKEVGYPQN